MPSSYEFERIAFPALEIFLYFLCAGNILSLQTETCSSSVSNEKKKGVDVCGLGWGLKTSLLVMRYQAFNIGCQRRRVEFMLGMFAWSCVLFVCILWCMISKQRIK